MCGTGLAQEEAERDEADERAAHISPDDRLVAAAEDVLGQHLAAAAASGGQPR